MKRIVLVPYTFVLMNWAAVAGLYYFLSGRRNIWKDIWQPPRTPRAQFSGGGAGS